MCMTNAHYTHIDRSVVLKANSRLLPDSCKIWECFWIILFFIGSLCKSMHTRQDQLVNAK